LYFQNDSLGSEKPWAKLSPKASRCHLIDASGDKISVNSYLAQTMLLFPVSDSRLAIDLIDNLIIKQREQTALERRGPAVEMESDQSVLHQLPGAYRHLQSQTSQGLQHNTGGHLGHHTLASQGPLDQLDHLDAAFHQDLRLPDHNEHPFDPSNPFSSNRPHAHQSLQPQVQNGSPHTPHQHNSGGGGQFGILTTGPVQHNSIGRLQQEDDMFGTPNSASDQNSNGHLSTKIVVDPPNLDEWRQKLFDVNDTITLSKDE
jgi:hypothetical protein